MDDVREQILSEVFLKPYLASRRVFIIGDGDVLSSEAQNALLKVLEEPPEYVTFLICVTKQDKLLSTVLSRSCVMSFFPLPVEEVNRYLAMRILAAAKRAAGGAAIPGQHWCGGCFCSDDSAGKTF